MYMCIYIYIYIYIMFTYKIAECIIDAMAALVYAEYSRHVVHVGVHAGKHV